MYFITAIRSQKTKLEKKCKTRSKDNSPTKTAPLFLHWKLSHLKKQVRISQIFVKGFINTDFMFKVKNFAN